MRYLAAPARPTPLLLIALFAVGLTLAAKASLLGLPLALILLSWTLKYAFVAFDTVWRGFDEPPVLSLEMVNPASEQRPLGILLIVGVFYGATEALGGLIGDTIPTILRYAALVLLPATIAALGITGSIVEAINPKTLIDVIRRFGTEYPIFLVVIVVFGGAIVSASEHAGWLTLQLAILLYGILALFCLLGGIIYQRRKALGVDAWQSPERTQTRETMVEDRAIAREIDDVYSHWRSGAHVEAWQEMDKILATRSRDLEAYRRYYPTLARWPDPRLANKLAREFISKLLVTQHNSEALRILRERLAATPEFRPANGAELVRLVTIARTSGDRPTARALLKDFEQHFPNDAARPIVEQLRD